MSVTTPPSSYSYQLVCTNASSGDINLYAAPGCVGPGFPLRAPIQFAATCSAPSVFGSGDGLFAYWTALCVKAAGLPAVPIAVPNATYLLVVAGAPNATGSTCDSRQPVMMQSFAQTAACVTDGANSSM